MPRALSDSFTLPLISEVYIPQSDDDGVSLVVSYVLIYPQCSFHERSLPSLPPSPFPPSLSPSLPSFSSPGGVLCGVGRDRHSKSHVVLWNTASLRPLSGEVTVLAQAHTDVSVHTMKIGHFDERRYGTSDMFHSFGRPISSVVF